MSVKISKKWNKTAEIYQQIGGEFSREELEELYFYETFGKKMFVEKYRKIEPKKNCVKKQLDLFIEEYIRPIKEGWFQPEEMYLNWNIDQKLFEMVLPDKYKINKSEIEFLQKNNPYKNYELLVELYTEFQEQYLIQKNQILKNCVRPFEPNESEQRRLMEIAILHFDIETAMQSEIEKEATFFN